MLNGFQPEKKSSLVLSKVMPNDQKSNMSADQALENTDQVKLLRFKTIQLATILYRSCFAGRTKQAWSARLRAQGRCRCAYCNQVQSGINQARAAAGATEFGVTVRARATEIQTGWACLIWWRIAHAFQRSCFKAPLLLEDLCLVSRTPFLYSAALFLAFNFLQLYTICNIEGRAQPFWYDYTEF